MVEGSGDLQTIGGDDALRNQHIDFLKMDVEGMELRALAGLKETIARCRPTMFVEVENQNIPEFRQWLSEVRYTVEATFRRYPQNENFLVRPVD